MITVDIEKQNALKSEKYDTHLMQKHVMPKLFSDNKWYCYRGLFGWSKGYDTQKECQIDWVDYCRKLDEMNNN